MKVLKGLAVDAMLGAVTGGIAPMLKFLVKSFGGFKFVMKILRQPLRRFAGKMDKKTIDSI